MTNSDGKKRPPLKRSVSEIIEQAIKNDGRASRSNKNPSEQYQLLIESSILICAHLDERKEKKWRAGAAVKRLAINNFLVNAVTAIEVYFRRIIKGHNGWNKQGIDFLLNDKISLRDAYQLIQKKHITPQYVISESYSFSEFGKINDVMKELLQCKQDFFSEFENWNFYTPKAGERYKGYTSFIKEKPNWRADMSSVYKKRNAFVHDGIQDKMTMQEVVVVYNFLFLFEFFMSEFLSEVHGVDI